MPWLRQRVLMQHEKLDPQNEASKVKKILSGKTERKRSNELQQSTHTSYM